MNDIKVRKDDRLLPKAKTLRKTMTSHERKLWYLFLRKYPIKIYKQRIIDHYIADFYCAKAKLVIEIDGSQHYTEQGQYADGNRNYVFEKYGLKVMRFSNREIDKEFDAVCEAIHNKVQSAITE